MVISGLDANNDGQLTGIEIMATQYICNGKDGLAGMTGAQGPTGALGAAGQDGVTGPVGATGVQGPTGITGAQGLTGAYVLWEAAAFNNPKKR